MNTGQEGSELAAKGGKKEGTEIQRNTASENKGRGELRLEWMKEKYLDGRKE